MMLGKVLNTPKVTCLPSEESWSHRQPRSPPSTTRSWSWWKISKQDLYTACSQSWSPQLSGRAAPDQLGCRSLYTRTRFQTRQKKNGAVFSATLTRGVSNSPTEPFPGPAPKRLKKTRFGCWGGWAWCCWWEESRRTDRTCWPWGRLQRREDQKIQWVERSTLACWCSQFVARLVPKYRWLLLRRSQIRKSLLPSSGA